MQSVNKYFQDNHSISSPNTEVVTCWVIPDYEFQSIFESKTLKKIKRLKMTQKTHICVIEKFVIIKIYYFQIPFDTYKILIKKYNYS